MDDQAKKYTAPALDKGLDILEVLADADAGLTQAEVARQLGRSVGEIFRMLVVLRRRGLVVLNERSDLYTLTTGLFELAADGTLFLDEVSEMPQDLQAKLLRVLQELSFRKVGGTRALTCSATIGASSNRNRKEEVEEESFRRELY